MNRECNSRAGHKFPINPNSEPATDTYDAYRGPEHRGSVSVPVGTPRKTVEAVVLETFGADFDRVTKREEAPPSDA
jgi:hypothetical protein